MYAYIVDNKISEIYPSDTKPGKKIKLDDDLDLSKDYMYDPSTDQILLDPDPPGPPVPTQVEIEEHELEALRQERDGLLAQTDWMIVKSADTGVGISTAWKNYRQSLRDITKTYKNQREVIWPTPPS